MAALSIINNKNYDEYNLRQLSQELVSCLNELSKNHHEISNTVGSVNNDKRSLDYVINKLTNKSLIQVVVICNYIHQITLLPFGLI